MEAPDPHEIRFRLLHPRRPPPSFHPPQKLDPETKHHDGGQPIADGLKGLANAIDKYLLSLNVVKYEGPPTDPDEDGCVYREAGKGVLRAKVNPFGVNVARVRVPLAALSSRRPDARRIDGYTSPTGHHRLGEVEGEEGGRGLGGRRRVAGGRGARPVCESLPPPRPLHNPLNPHRAAG